MVDDNQVKEDSNLEKPSMFGMIMNPIIQFERIKYNPKILVALIVVTLLTILGMFMMTTGTNFTNDPQFADFTEEELMVATVTEQIGSALAGLFTPGISILFSAAIYLAIAKIAHYDKVTFKQLVSMNVYIYVIPVLSVLINGLAMMLVGSSNMDVLFTSVNSIVDAEGALGAFLNTIEVFTIWNLILTALGLQLVANFSKGLSWGIVIAFYIISTGFAMLGAGLITMLGV